MSYPQNIWNQLKNITVNELIRALEKDGWEREKTPGAILAYNKPVDDQDHTKRVTIHYHPKKTYGPKFLKGLIEDIGWSIDDLKRLKLIK